MKNLLIVVAICFNLALMFFGGKTLVQSEGLRRKVAFLNKDLLVKETALKEERVLKEKFQKNYQDLIQVKKQVEAELSESKKEAAELAKKLSAEKKRRKQLERKLKAAESQVRKLKNEVQLEKEKRSDLEKRLQRMAGRLERQQDDKSSLLSRLDNVKKERDGLKDKLEKLSQGDPKYSLAEVTISQQKKYSGVVLNVNPKYNFVILSLGKDQGVVPGIQLVVHRGAQLLGKVVVEKVFDKMCSAKVQSLTEGVTLQVEDQVRKF